MSELRLSFGQCSCRSKKNRNNIVNSVCGVILNKLEALSLLNFEQISSLPEEDFYKSCILRKEITVAIYREQLSIDSHLIVVQIFYPTLKFPTYFSFSGIGKIFADGLIFYSSGEKKKAEEEYLYPYW